MSFFPLARILVISQIGKIGLESGHKNTLVARLRQSSSTKLFSELGNLKTRDVHKIAFHGFFWPLHYHCPPLLSHTITAGFRSRSWPLHPLSHRFSARVKLSVGEGPGLLTRGLLHNDPGYLLPLTLYFRVREPVGGD